MSFYLCGTALLAIASGASAQTSGSEAEAQAPSPSAADPETLGEIVVTGIRASLERAQDIKRNADSVVDAVTFEDLGKFTDNNVVDSLQRVPGIQISRNDAGNGGDRVSIRGLGPLFTAYTVNGRTVFGSGTEGGNELRAFNLDVVPPEVISGLVVHKTPTASDNASGLAGQVDVQTLKPLDSSFSRGKSIFGTLSARSEYDQNSEKLGGRISGVIGGTFLDNTLGVYLSGVYSRGFRQRSQLANGPLFDRRVLLDTNGNRAADAGDTLAIVDAPGARGHSLIDETLSQVSFSGGVQYRPSDSIELYVDGFVTDSDNDSLRDRLIGSLQDFTVQAAGGLPGILLDPSRVSFTDVAVGGVTRRFLSSALPGAFITTINGASTSGAFAGGTGPTANSQISVAQQVFDNESRVSMLGGGGKFEFGSSKIAVDVFRQWTSYFQRFESWNVRAPLAVSSVGFDETARFPTVTGFAPVVTNSTLFAGSSGLSRDILMDINTTGGALDYTYKVDEGFIRALRFGGRYTQTNLDRRVSATTSVADSSAVAGSANYVPSYVTGGLTDRYFSGSPTGFEQFVSLSIAGLRNAFPTIVNATIDTLGVDPRVSFRQRERSLALYGRLDFESGIVAGNVGLRAVRTGVRTNTVAASTDGAGRVIPNTPVTNVVTDSLDWQYLPSLNFNIALAENLALRLGASRVASRPELIDLAPVTVINASLGITPSGPIGVAQGNSELKPYTANQVDATLEWYTPHRGAVVASIFYKDVKNFIATRAVANAQNTNLPATVNGFNYTYNVTSPINLASGSVFGAEIGFNQPLWGALDGFGLQANYTYVSTKADSQLGVDSSGFPGASKHNVNASAYFDKYGLNMQLTLSYRGDYLRNLAGTGTQTSLSRFTEAQTFLNFNASYKIFEAVEISVAALNITNEVRRDYAGSKAYYLDGFQNGRQFTLGARYSF